MLTDNQALTASEPLRLYEKPVLTETHASNLLNSIPGGEAADTTGCVCLFTS